MVDILGRSDAGEQLVPDEHIKTIIEEVPQQSVMLQRAQTVRMSSKKQKQPVLATLPEAFWVDGDTGLKQTSKATWKGVTMTAEELAVIVPIPDAVIDDATVDLWNIIKPQLVAAIGRKIDQATLFGVDKPDSWPTDIVSGATNAGNTVSVGVKKNHADATIELAEKLGAQGHSVNGFVGRPGLGWKIRGLKDANGTYYYGSPANVGAAGSFFGYPIDEAKNGAWDATKAELILADWTKFIIGIRQDITFETFSEGVISDAAGKVLFNLMQQDSKAMRVVMRLGFQVANPLNVLEPDEAHRYPAGVVAPKAATSGP